MLNLCIHKRQAEPFKNNTQKNIFVQTKNHTNIKPNQYEI